MDGIFIKIVPVILTFAVGYVLKRVGILTKEDGDLFLRLVFYVALPSLIVVSVAAINLETNLLYLPLAAGLIILATSAIAFWIGRLLQLFPPTFGSFLLGSAIMNTGFLLPFFIAAYGEEGLARMSLFDFGNGLLVYTFLYYIACKFGTNGSGPNVMARKFLASPPIWALLVAIALNMTNFQMPLFASTFFQSVGGITLPLIMLSLGIYFSPKLVKPAPMFFAVFIRMILGFALGLVVVKLFHLEGLNRIVVLLGAAAPAGYNTLTFSSLEHLDKEFAASIVSFSILLGILIAPALLFLLS